MKQKKKLVGVVRRVFDDWADMIEKKRFKEVYCLYSDDAVLFPAQTADVILSPVNIINFLDLFLENKEIQYIKIKDGSENIEQIRNTSILKYTGIYDIEWMDLKSGKKEKRKISYAFFFKNQSSGFKIIMHKSELNLKWLFKKHQNFFGVLSIKNL